MAGGRTKPHHRFRRGRADRTRVHRRLVAASRSSDHGENRRCGAERQGRLLTAPARRLPIGIATEWLPSFGGGELVLQQLIAMYPSARSFTSVFHPEALPANSRTWDVRP